mgnify:CR=1 FL=1
MKIMGRLGQFFSGERHFRETIKGASSNFIIQIAGIALGYCVVFMVSYIYGANGLGIYTLAFAVTSVFVMFGKVGFDTAIVKLVSEYHDDNMEYLSKLFSLVAKFGVLINITLSFMMFFLSPYIAQYIFSDPALEIYLKVMSLAIFPMAFRSIIANAFRGKGRIALYSLLQNVYVHLVFILVVLVLRQFSGAILYLLVSFVFSVWFVFFIGVWRWARVFGFGFYRAYDRSKIREVFGLSLPMLLNSSLVLTLTWTDSVMLGVYATSVDVGLYSAAMKMASSSLILLMAFNSILAPKVAKLNSTKSYSHIRSLVRSSNKIIIPLSLVAAFFLIIFTPYVFPLFGPEFGAAYSIFIVLMCGMVVKIAFGLSEFLLQMIGHHKVVAKISILGVIINVILNAVLIPPFGGEGAAIASSIGISSMCGLFYYYLRCRTCYSQ